MLFLHSAFPPESDPGEMISDRSVRALYERFLELLRSFHDDVLLETTRVDVRVYFAKELLCRVVPYGELFHVQVGDESAWEIRVRDEAACFSTLDRVLERFLDIYASGEAVHP